MNNQEIVIAVQEIFRDIFDDSDLAITELTNADDIEEWDSLEHINIILAIERRFNLKFNVDEVSYLKNVGDIINLIINKIEER